MQLMDSWIALLKESKGSVYQSPEWAKSLEMDGKKKIRLSVGIE